MKETFEIPFPPSVNHYWRIAGKRMVICSAGRKHRKAVEDLAWQRLLPRFGNQRIVVHIEARPPDNLRRDLDNILKCSLDSLQHAGVFDDDSQIDDLRIVRGSKKHKGALVVTIAVT